MEKCFILFSFFFQSIICCAQVPVSKEPRHHNVFENAFVRVLDVHLPPGDTSLFHKHETPSVFIVLHPVKTGSEVIIEEAKATALTKDPTITFEGFYVKPRIHRVWNSDTSDFHVMDIEILNKVHQNISPMEHAGFQILFNEKPVTAYRLSLNAGADIKLKRESPFLIVGLSDATNNVTVNKKPFSKKGDFLFIPAGESIKFSSKEEKEYSFAVLELK
jgi:hypothetical protein